MEERTELKGGNEASYSIVQSRGTDTVRALYKIHLGPHMEYRLKSSPLSSGLVVLRTLTHF
jgi:hypothetical protein